MSQSAYNTVKPPVVSTSPSRALSVVPQLLRKLGADKSEDWRKGASEALLAIEVGLQRDGVLPTLLLKNKLHALETEKQELERKLEAEKASNEKYRKLILDLTSAEA